MNNLRLFENEYGYHIDYIFNNNNNKKCLRLSEDNDYFSFSLFSPDEKLENKFILNINEKSPIFKPLNTLLNENNYIEVLEEGSDEGKSFALKRKNNEIDMTFNLTNTPKNTISISITNVRLSSPNVTFSEDSPNIDDFKNKLHNLLQDIKNSLKENIM